MSSYRTFGVVCLGVLCGVIVAGCAAASARSLDEAKEFNAYPLYYAGDEVDGLPLEDVNGVTGVSGKRKKRKLGRQAIKWTFFYGTCTPSPGSEGGCGPPLEVQNWSTCVRWFSGLRRRKRRLYDFHGAKATGGGGRYELSPMEIFTGRTTVVIFGNRKDIIKSAARALRRVRRGRSPSRLPPPAPGSLYGKLRCQHRPL